MTVRDPPPEEGQRGGSRPGSLWLPRARRLRDVWCRTEQVGGAGCWGRFRVRSRARVGEGGAESMQAEVFIVVVPVPPQRGGWRVMRYLAPWSPWRPPGRWDARSWPAVASGWRTARWALRDGCSARWWRVGVDELRPR